MQPVLPVQATRPARMLEAFDGQADRLQARLDLVGALGGDAGDQQVLPDGEADIAVAQLVRDAGQPAHLRRRHAAHGQRNADPDAARLLLRMHADVRLPVLPVRLRHLIAGNAAQRLAELGFDGGQELLEAPVIEHILETRLLAVGAVAVIDEHAHDGIGHRNGVLGLDQHAASAARNPDGR